jgi:glutamate-ammonia-ligase adenylyltransferase
MGYSDSRTFADALAGHRRDVHRHFQMLLETGQADGGGQTAEKQFSAVWQGALDDDAAVAQLTDGGYQAPEKIVGLLSYLRKGVETKSLSASGRQRLDKLMPVLLKEIGKGDQPDQTLQRIIDLIKSIERRTSYLALLLEHPVARAQLIRLSAASPWLASFLARHPVLLDELLYPQTLAGPPEAAVLNSDIDRRLSQVDDQDLEAQIEALCIFKQVNVLRVAAADVSGILPLMRVSDHLSAIAESIVQRVVDLAWQHLVAKHGRPAARLADRSCERGFSVVAYGKLGGLELGYGSDLDLVFLHAGSHGTTQGAESPIDNSQFFNRLGQRVIHILTAHTRAGRAYEIDMRLRPSGNAGVLVSHIEGFQNYQLHEAWTFEHQALIKARPICGDAALTDRFESIRRQVLRLPRIRGKLKKEVLDMRERMRRELLKPDPETFDLKQEIGGMVDIEFLVQYLVLQHSQRFRELTDWTDTVRLLQALSRTEIIHENTAHLLKHAYLIYRAVAHQLSLQEAPALIHPDKYEPLQKRVRELWQSIFANVDNAPLNS